MYLDFKEAELEKLIAANLAAPGFNLMRWTAECGTHGCLYGNYRIASDNALPIARFMMNGILPFISAADDFGISKLESHWLFNSSLFVRTERGFSVDSTGLLTTKSKYRNNDLTEALNRVRKFLAYKLRKRALWYEADGRVKESARRTEGNLMVTQQVLDTVYATAV
jgi:hypothetical protein